MIERVATNLYIAWAYLMGTLSLLTVAFTVGLLIKWTWAAL